MTEKEIRLTKVVNDYENGKIAIHEAIEEFNKLSNRKIDIYTLNNYWRSENLTNFISRFAIDPIENWGKIDDREAIKLINEIKENLGNIALEERNIVALAKRYAKPEGALYEIIHKEKAIEVLDFLKKDDIIRL